MDMKNLFSITAATLLATATAHAGLLQDAHPVDATSASNPPPAVTAPPPAAAVTPPASAATQPVTAGENTEFIKALNSLDQAPGIPPAPKKNDTPRRLAHGAFAAFGKSDGSVLAVSIGTDYQFDKEWMLGSHGRINPYGELVLSYWEGKKGHTGVSSLHEAGAMMFARYRYLRTPLASIRPFVDLGAGLHYVTEDRIEGKELGRNWLASSNIGAGFLFGRSERFEVGARIRHLSNAGTADLNWGVNQILARVAVRF